MQITKLIRKKEDGTIEATLLMSEEQAQFLVSFAIAHLVTAGIVTVVEQEATEEPEANDGEPTPFITPNTSGTLN